MTSLERRYRKLLRWYPRWHRVRHEEEMIAILLTGAAPGRRRPAVSDAFDLVRGGLRVRLNHAIGAPSAPHWRRAAELTAFLGPLMLFAVDIAKLAGVPVWFYTAGYGWPAQSPGVMVAKLLGFALPYLLVAALVWARWRVAAAGCAWTWAVLHAWLVATPRGDLPYIPAAPPLAPSYISVDPGPAGLAILLGVLLLSPTTLIAVILTVAPSPGPGPMRAGQVLAWTTAGMTAVFVIDGLPMVGGPFLRSVPLLAFLVAAAGVALRSAAGRRVMFILLLLLTVNGNYLRPGLAVLAIGLVLVAVRAIGSAPAAARE